MPTTNVLEQAKECFKGVRQNLIVGAGLLYKIREEKLWEGKYDSFGEFVEEDCQMSEGQASKLLTVWGHFVVQAGVSHAKLSGVDMEKLYMATRLDTKPELALAQAFSLSRAELRQEIKDPNDECPHSTTIVICANCNRRV